jgi:hypothetical protein
MYVGGHCNIGIPIMYSVGHSDIHVLNTYRKLLAILTLTFFYAIVAV